MQNLISPHGELDYPEEGADEKQRKLQIPLVVSDSTSEPLPGNPEYTQAAGVLQRAEVLQHGMGQHKPSVKWVTTC